MPSDFIVAFVTSPDRKTSEALASALVEERIAACVNIVPGLVSVYRWEGKINKDPEELLIIKTRAGLFETLARRVKELHPYDVPEVVSLPIVEGANDYLGWLADSTREG